MSHYSFVLLSSCQKCQKVSGLPSVVVSVSCLLRSAFNGDYNIRRKFGNRKHELVCSFLSLRATGSVFYAWGVLVLHKAMMLNWNKLCMDSMGEAMLWMDWMSEAMLCVNWKGDAMLCMDWMVRNMRSIADTGATTWSIRSSTVTTRKANRVIGSWLIVDVTRHDVTHRQHCNSVYRLIT